MNNICGSRGVKHRKTLEDRIRIGRYLYALNMKHNIVLLVFLSVEQMEAMEKETQEEEEEKQEQEQEKEEQE